MSSLITQSTLNANLNEKDKKKGLGELNLGVNSSSAKPLNAQIQVFDEKAQTKAQNETPNAPTNTNAPTAPALPQNETQSAQETPQSANISDEDKNFALYMNDSLEKALKAGASKKEIVGYLRENFKDDKSAEFWAFMDEASKGDDEFVFDAFKNYTSSFLPPKPTLPENKEDFTDTDWENYEALNPPKFKGLKDTSKYEQELQNRGFLNQSGQKLLATFGLNLDKSEHDKIRHNIKEKLRQGGDESDLSELEKRYLTYTNETDSANKVINAAVDLSPTDFFANLKDNIFSSVESKQKDELQAIKNELKDENDYKNAVSKIKNGVKVDDLSDDEKMSFVKRSEYYDLAQGGEIKKGGMIWRNALKQIKDESEFANLKSIEDATPDQIKKLANMHEFLVRNNPLNDDKDLAEEALSEIKARFNEPERAEKLRRYGALVAKYDTIDKTKQLTYAITSKLGSNEKLSKDQQDYLDFLNELADKCDFDGIGVSNATGELGVIDKEGNFYTFKDGGIQNFLEIMGASKWNIGASTAGYIYGSKKGKTPRSKFINSIIYGLGFGIVGSGADYVDTALQMDTKFDGEALIHKAVTEGALQFVFDGLALGVNKLTQGGKSLINAPKKAASWVGDNTLAIGALRNLRTQNLRGAENILAVDKELKKGIDDAYELYGGRVGINETQFLQKGADKIKAKFGENSKEAKLAQGLSDMVNLRNLKDRQNAMIEYIRADESGRALGFLTEVASRSPLVQQNLKIILNKTSADLTHKLENLGIQKMDIKKVYDDLASATESSYNEVMDDILAKLYPKDIEKYKASIDTKPFEDLIAKFKDEKTLVDDVSKIFKKDIIDELFSAEKLSFTQLNNVRKNLNAYTRDLLAKRPSFQNTLSLQLQKELRTSIDNAIKDIFRQNPVAFSKASELYETALKDYADMKGTLKIIDNLKSANTKTWEDNAVKSLINFAKGQGDDMSNLARLTQHLAPENRAVVEMNILKQLFEKSRFIDELTNIDVFDSGKFLEKLSKLTGKNGEKAVFESTQAKEMVQMVNEFHTLFKKDADIARRLSPARTGTPAGTSSIATNIGGKVNMARVKMLWEMMIRNLPEAFWLPKSLNEAVKGAALRYHLHHALSRSGSVSEFKQNFSEAVKRTPHTPQAQKIIKDMQKAFDEMEILSKDLARMSDEELLTRETIKKIENSTQKGSEMALIGRENLNTPVLEYLQKNDKKAAIEIYQNDDIKKALEFKHDDVRRTIQGSEINHALNRHGKKSELAKNGQPAITLDDIANYADLADSANVKLFGVTSKDLPSVINFKQVNGYYVVVEEVRKGQNELAFQTMYKGNGDFRNSEAFKKATSPDKAAFQGYKPHARTPKADSGDNFSTNTAQSQATPKEPAQTAQKSLKNAEIQSKNQTLDEKAISDIKNASKEQLENDLKSIEAKQAYNKQTLDYYKQNFAENSQQEIDFIEKQLLKDAEKQKLIAQRLDELKEVEKRALKNADESGDIIFKDNKGKKHILDIQTQELWKNTFNLKNIDDEVVIDLPKELKETLGKDIKLKVGSLYKLVAQGREEFIPQIKEVLQSPELALKDSENGFLFVKHLKDDDYFVNVSVDKGEYLISISNGIKSLNNLKNKLDNGANILYQSPNANSNLQTLLQASLYSANKIDKEIIPNTPPKSQGENQILAENVVNFIKNANKEQLENELKNIEGNNAYNKQALDYYKQRLPESPYFQGDIDFVEKLLLKDAEKQKLIAQRLDELKEVEKRALKNADDEIFLREKFGKNYAEFKGKGQEAVNHLLKVKSGQVQGAFFSENLAKKTGNGEIDLVFGDENMGLSHILKKHGDEFVKFDGNTQGDKIANALSDIIEKGKIIERGSDKINIEHNGFLVGLNKGFDGVGKNRWIVTAYDNTISITEKNAKRSPAGDFTGKTPLLPNSVDKIIPKENSKSQIKNKKEIINRKLDIIDEFDNKQYELWNSELHKEFNNLQDEINKTLGKNLGMHNADISDNYNALSFLRYDTFNPLFNEAKIPYESCKKLKTIIRKGKDIDFNDIDLSPAINTFDKPLLFVRNYAETKLPQPFRDNLFKKIEQIFKKIDKKSQENIKEFKKALKGAKNAVNRSLVAEKTTHFVDNYAKTAKFKSLSNEKQQAILSLKDIKPSQMPDELAKTADFENVVTHFDKKLDSETRKFYLKLFEDTKNAPDIVLESAKNENIEYIKAFQHTQTKDLYYLAFTQKNGVTKITGIPTTQIRKVIKDIAESKKVLNAEDLGGIKETAEPTLKSPSPQLVDEIIPKIQNKFKQSEQWAKNLFEWHKDSSPLTKEADGTPKVFYHATSADKEFEIFDKDKIHSGYGFWFGDDIKSQAVQEAKTGNAPIYKVFLKMKKPFEVLEPINKNNYKEFEKIFDKNFEKEVKNNEKIAEFEAFVKKELNADEVDIGVVNFLWSVKKNGIWKDYRGNKLNEILTPKIQQEAQKYLDKEITRKIYYNYLPRAYDKVDKKEAEQVKQRLIKNGYDSIKLGDEYVVFDSNQIKSINNKGAFDGTNPNILMANQHLGAGLLGGTLNGIETDENGNVIGFSPEKFVAGFLGGAGASKATQFVLKNPKIRAKADKFLKESGEFIVRELRDPNLSAQARQGLERLFGKALVRAMDSRAFIIAGENAIGANKAKLARAKTLQKAGKSDDEIWLKTGWYEDKDGKWKFEINPQGGEFKKDFRKLGDEVFLSEILKDNKLFKAYPSLETTFIEFKDYDFGADASFRMARSYGEMRYIVELEYKRLYNEALDEFQLDDMVSEIVIQDNGIGVITLNSISDYEMLKYHLYHEIQHAVQEIENFAKGGNVETAFNNATKNEQKSILKTAKKLNIDPDYLAYKRLHGEVEARNVEQRMANTKEAPELVKTHPHKTQDTAKKDTIIKFDEPYFDEYKQSIKNLDTMSGEDLDKGKNLKLDRFRDSNGNVDKNALRPYAESMPTLQIKSVKDFKNAFDEKKGKFGYIQTPYKPVKVDMVYAYKHFYENSSKQNRDLIKSAFFTTFKDPLFVATNSTKGRDSVYFYKPFYTTIFDKDKNKKEILLSLFGVGVDSEGRVDFATFYKDISGSRFKEMLGLNDENIIYMKENRPALP